MPVEVVIIAKCWFLLQNNRD